MSDLDEVVSEDLFEACELCGHPMPDGCIGWCAECDAQGKRDFLDDLADAGGIFAEEM